MALTAQDPAVQLILLKAACHDVARLHPVVSCSKFSTVPAKTKLVFPRCGAVRLIAKMRPLRYRFGPALQVVTANLLVARPYSFGASAVHGGEENKT